MALSGLVGILTLIVAVYAIARPVQRRSIMLFVPAWLVPSGVIFSALLLFVLLGLNLAEVSVPALLTLLAHFCAFGSPLVAVAFAVLRWKRCELSLDRDSEFNSFLRACLRERSYDELVRIIHNNEGVLHRSLSKETLMLLYDKRFVHELFCARTWTHLSLMTEGGLREKLGNACFHLSDSVMRELATVDNSILHMAIIRRYGGDESWWCTKEEEDLIEKTIGNYQWVLDWRAEYPLVMLAQESLASGNLDAAYNRNDPLYEAGQGTSSRIRCPLFLAEKAVLMATESAAKRGEDFEWLTDLWDLFRIILPHSVCDESVWDGENRNTAYATPFAYMLHEICSDFRRLVHAACTQAIQRWHGKDHSGSLPPNTLAKSVVRYWAFSLMNLVFDFGNVAEEFGIRLIRDYLYLALKSAGNTNVPSPRSRM